MILYRVEDEDTGAPVYNRHGNCWYQRKASATRAMHQFKRRFKSLWRRHESNVNYKKLRVAQYDVTERKSA